AVETVAILLSLVAPYTAEDMWARLGHEPTVARTRWPEVDESLLVQETVTAVVQVMGKVRARLEVQPDVSEADLRERALAAVAEHVDGREVRRVIVRPPALGNVVVGRAGETRGGRPCRAPSAGPTAVRACASALPWDDHRVSRRPSGAPAAVRITDVARAAGVSSATVSRVLNGASTVDPELARRVREAAKASGYV